MGKEIQLRLDSLDLGQVLDGLRARQDSWQKTADFLDSGNVADAAFISEECNDATEAASIARHYSQIISQIERQVKEQGG